MAGTSGESVPLIPRGESRWGSITGKTTPSLSAGRRSSSSRRRRSCAYCRGTAGVAAAGVLVAVALLGVIAISGSIGKENVSRVLPRPTTINSAAATASATAAASTVVHGLDRTTEDIADRSGTTLNGGHHEEDPTKGATEEGTGAGVVATSKPNVFFIMIDDMGWNDIGYQSTDLVGITPNLDKLAAGGVKMTQYYSMSICTPARASFLTGRYPIRYGLQYDVIQPGAPWGLPLTEKIFPQYMKDAGYETHMVGKWHLGSYDTGYTPHRRGFDTYLGYLNDEEMYSTHQMWTSMLDGRKFFDFGFGNATDYYDVIDRSGAPIPPMLNDDGGDDDDNFSTGPTSSFSSSSNSFKGKYSTTVFQERAIEIIRDKTPHDENPLFIYLSHQAVHDPLGLPPSDAFTADEWAILDALEEKSGSALRLRFAKVLMYLDKTIGELVAYLEEEGWMENSIIAVASDNGGCPSAGGSNYPLRGLKHSYWEGAVKVPALVYSTSHIPEEAWGTEYAELMHVTDWLPTLASAVDFETSGSNGDLDGLDHWAHITSPDLVASSSESPRTEMLYNFDPYILWADGEAIAEPDYPLAQGAYRLGKWKLIFNVWCQGYYTFDQQVLTTDYLTNSSNTCQDGGSCSECGAPCVGSADLVDGLFDLEADPREETNVMDLYPEVVNDIRTRLAEVVSKEYTNSSYEDINTDAYEVWAEHDWWVIPWVDLLGGRQ